jgi:hypothetical protein
VTNLAASVAFAHRPDYHRAAAVHHCALLGREHELAGAAEGATMAINLWKERLGQVSIAPGASVGIGWQLFDNESPPIVDHTIVFGFDSFEHVVRVGLIDHVGPNSRAFRYRATNVSAGPAPVVVPMHYIFFKEV